MLEQETLSTLIIFLCPSETPWLGTPWRATLSHMSVSRAWTGTGGGDKDYFPVALQTPSKQEATQVHVSHVSNLKASHR